jgi:hypothetical protein
MTVDLTGIAASLVAGVFTILSIVLPVLINAHVKNQSAASTLDKAVGNSLGTLANLATSALASSKVVVSIPGVPAALMPGVQYVIDHASDEMKQLGVTSTAVASKIDARLGLAKMEAAQASAAGSSTTVTVTPTATPPSPAPAPPAPAPAAA